MSGTLSHLTLLLTVLCCYLHQTNRDIHEVYIRVGYGVGLGLVNSELHSQVSHQAAGYYWLDTIPPGLLKSCNDEISLERAQFGTIAPFRNPCSCRLSFLSENYTHFHLFLSLYTTIPYSKIH